MRRGYLAMKNGSWEAFKEGYKKEVKSCQWTFLRIREAYEKVAKDEIGRLGIVREILRKSMDFLRRISRQSTEWAGSLCRMFAHIATVSPWRTTFRRFLQGTAMVTTERRSTATGGARLVEANQPTRNGAGTHGHERQPQRREKVQLWQRDKILSSLFLQRGQLHRIRTDLEDVADVLVDNIRPARHTEARSVCWSKALSLTCTSHKRCSGP